MSKRRRGERGIASFSGNYPPELYYISFDENNKPIGVTRKRFMSWYGMMVQHNLPYHVETGKLDAHYFEDLWLETKRAWNIKTDAPKAFMRKKAVKIGTNFRSRLVRHYVNRGLNACHKYPFLDPEQWENFVLQKTSVEFKEKSEKAKVSSSKKRFILRLGRGGWTALEEKMDIIWPQLVKNHENFKHLQSHRSKMYLAACAMKNKKTKVYELPSDALEDFKKLYQEEQKMIADGSFSLNTEDPLLRILGPEHGGRARTVSEIIGYTKVHGGLYKNVNHDRDSIPQVDVSPNFRDSSYGSGGRFIDYPPIESRTSCVLLLNVADSQLEVAYGMAWPTSESLIHQKPIMDGCVKVTVDEIVNMYENLPVPRVTMTSEVRIVKHMFHTIVQWPRHAVEFVNKETPSKSTATPSTTLTGVSSSKSTSPPSMASSGGSPSKSSSASLQIQPM